MNGAAFGTGLNKEVIIIVFFFFSDRERAEFNKSCNLISGSLQPANSMNELAVIANLSRFFYPSIDD